MEEGKAVLEVDGLSWFDLDDQGEIEFRELGFQGACQVVHGGGGIRDIEGQPDLREDV